MARIARVVISGYPHHIIQRGNRRQELFFSDEDRKTYLDYLQLYTKTSGIDFVDSLEKITGRILRKQKPGLKKRLIK